MILKLKKRLAKRIQLISEVERYRLLITNSIGIKKKKSFSEIYRDILFDRKPFHLIN